MLESLSNLYVDESDAARHLGSALSGWIEVSRRISCVCVGKSRRRLRSRFLLIIVDVKVVPHLDCYCVVGDGRPAMAIVSMQWIDSLAAQCAKKC